MYGKLAESKLASRSVDRTLSDAANDNNNSNTDFVLKVHKCKSQETGREPSMREINHFNQQPQNQPYYQENRKFIESKQVTERRSGLDEQHQTIANRLSHCPILTAE